MTVLCEQHTMLFATRQLCLSKECDHGQTFVFWGGIAIFCPKTSVVDPELVFFSEPTFQIISDPDPITDQTLFLIKEANAKFFNTVMMLN